VVNFRIAALGTGIQVDSVRSVASLITVGPSGNYQTVNDAIRAASKLWPDYASKGLAVEIRILSGFVMAEQVFVVQQDLSFITITSVDAEVPVQRSAINQGNGTPSTNNWRTGTYPLFCAMRNGVLPYIKTLFSFDTSGTGRGTVGVYLFEGGRGVIGLNSGVKGAGWRGLYVDGGWSYFRSSIWTGSGKVGGPDTGSFTVGGYGVRVSNNGMGMGRGADVSGSYTGVYASKGFVDCNDMLAENCDDIGFAITDHGYMTVSGASANGSPSGFRVDQGANLYGGESSETPGSFTRAIGGAGYPLVVLNGSIAAFDNPEFVSTGTNAALIRNSGLRVNAGRMVTTAGSRWALQLEGGADVTVNGGKIEGTLGEVFFPEESGSIFRDGGNTRDDGVSPIRSNLRGGDFSPLGEYAGRDDRTEIYSTDASFSLNSDSAPEFVVTAALTGTRDCSMYVSTNWPSKRHTIIHSGSGSPINVYNEGAKINRLAVVAAKESVLIEPDGAGGWRVVQRYRTLTGRTVGASAVTLTPASQYIRSSGAINVATSITMYAASDGSAREHTFSRADAGSASWSIYEPNGTTLIVALAANQWAQIVPRSDGTAWYVATKGAL